jgi:hypothetical protein
MPPALKPRSRRPPSPAPCRPGERARRQVGGHANTESLPKPSDLSVSATRARVLRARTVGTPLEAVLAQPGQFRHSSLTLTTVYTGLIVRRSSRLRVPAPPQKSCWIDAGSVVDGRWTACPATSAPPASSSSAGWLGREWPAPESPAPPSSRPDPLTGNAWPPIVMRARRHRPSAQGRGGSCGSARMSRTRGQPKSKLVFHVEHSAGRHAARRQPCGSGPHSQSATRGATRRRARVRLQPLCSCHLGGRRPD